MTDSMKCECVMQNRLENESERDWLKRCFCMHHWMQTDYYMEKLAGQQSEGEPVQLRLQFDEVEPGLK